MRKMKRGKVSTQPHWLCLKGRGVDSLSRSSGQTGTLQTECIKCCVQASCVLGSWRFNLVSWVNVLTVLRFLCRTRFCVDFLTSLCLPLRSRPHSSPARRWPSTAASTTTTSSWLRSHACPSPWTLTLSPRRPKPQTRVRWRGPASAGSGQCGKTWTCWSATATWSTHTPAWPSRSPTCSSTPSTGACTPDPGGPTHIPWPRHGLHTTDYTAGVPLNRNFFMQRAHLHVGVCLRRAGCMLGLWGIRMPQLQPLWTLSPASCPQQVTKISFFDDMNRSVDYNLFSHSIVKSLTRM